MTYEFAMKYMEEVQKRGSVMGLKPIQNLLNRLGNPQNRLKIIHVAGTNGKGSICTFLEKLYLYENKKVGRYISPTLHCYLERFQVKGELMSETEFAELFSLVYPHIMDMERQKMDLPTAFEIETVLAFLFFVKRGCDIVILETGMGGRWDATNVIEHPICTVFASIGMDHMQFLGDTIEAIAYEKAGIMKPDCPVVSYPNQEAVEQVLMNNYRELNPSKGDTPVESHSMVSVVRKDEITILEETLYGSVFLYKGEEYRISLGGRYQIYNAVTAIETKLLLDGYLDKRALSHVKWEGRFEVVREKPLFIRDGAHNIDGVAALKETIENHFTNRDLIFIIGVLKDKEYEKMMAMLCPFASRIFTITPNVERGLSGKVLAEVIKPYCNEVQAVSTIDEAVTQAVGSAKETSVIIAWGSLSYIGQIK